MLDRGIVGYRRGRQVARLERVGIGEGLERCSGLAIAGGGIDRRRGGGGARAADISEHVAGRVVDDDHRAVARAPGQAVELTCAAGGRDPLEARGERRGEAPPRLCRSEERRVGKACVRTCSSWWSPDPFKT